MREEVALDINKLTKKVDRNNKKQEDQVQQHTQEVTREINEVRDVTTEQIQRLTERSGHSKPHISLTLSLIHI